MFKLIIFSLFFTNLYMWCLLQVSKKLAWVPFSLALNGGGRIFHSPSSLIFPACSPVLSDLLRDSLCTALQTEKLWIWSTGLSTLLTPSWRYLPIRNHDNRYFADWIICWVWLIPCLLELDHFPCCKVCLWFMCFCWGVFSCSHTVLPKEHSLGVIFFSPHFPPVML